jgi:hypothetical protein
VITIQTKIDGAAEIVRAMDAIEGAIDTAVSGSLGRRVGKEGVRIVKKLTPRQRSRSRTGSTKRGFPPLHSQWELIERVATGNKYEASIRNRAASNPEGLAILASLEFGAKAHDILPGGPYPLKWKDTSKTRFVGRTSILDSGRVDEVRIGRVPGAEVFARKVRHPGNAPFHMVADAREEMKLIADAVLINFQQEIERTFGSLTIRVR